MTKEYSLVGINGNAFSVMGYVTKAMKEQKYKKAEIDAYMEKAMSGNYDNLIMESMQMLDEINEKVAESDF